MIPTNIERGTLVEHIVWKRGKVLKVHPPHVTIYFASLTGSLEGPSRKLQLNAPQLSVASVQSDPLLDGVSLRKSGALRTKPIAPVKVKPTLHTLEQTITWFERTYPKRFSDPKLIDMELTYKRDAHKVFLKHFGLGRGRALLKARKVVVISKALDELYHATNIPAKFEIMAVHDGLEDGAAAARLLRGVLDFLDEPDPSSFGRLVDAVSKLPAPPDGAKVLTWPNVTILPFLGDPKRFMVLKPSITKRMARRLGFDLVYSSPPTWHTYEALLRMSTLLLERLSPLGAKDFIDVQSFIWVTQDLE